MAGGCCVEVTGGRGEGDDQPRQGESLATASQEARHVACELFRGRRGREPGSDGARPINQEFREIPLYAIAQQPALLLLEPDIEWVGVAAVDLDLGEQRKRDPIGALAECRDLRIRPRLLMAELVAWEGEDFKAARPELFAEILQALVLRREPAFRGDIDDQKHLAAEVGEMALLAGAQPGAEIVDRHLGLRVRRPAPGYAMHPDEIAVGRRRSLGARDRYDSPVSLQPCTAPAGPIS